MSLHERILPAVAALALAALLATPACQKSPRRAAQADSAAVARQDSITARDVVVQFGSRLKDVPLLASDSTLARAMQTQYGGLVSPQLLQKWAADPRHAAGRLTSSPWPDHIEIASMTRKSARVFFVDGSIVERTSADPTGEAGRTPVRVVIWGSGVSPKGSRMWMIQDFEQGPAGATTADLGGSDSQLTPERAAAVVRAYYDAVTARRYQDAYRMWEADGAASGQSLIEFLNSYAQFKTFQANVGAPGPVGAAAGSRYVEVPVQLQTTNRRGTRQDYAGTITLRGSVVDGATAKQRTWQIYAAKITKQQPA